MITEPQQEHLWLRKLVGNWSVESDEPSGSCGGSETCRMLGDLWAVGEGEGAMPDGGRTSSLITIGFDPDKNTFVGSFVCSVMGSLWVYTHGSLDAEGKTLTMACEGPNFIANDGTMTQFKDIIALENDDYRTFTGLILNGGEWVRIMHSHYRRQ